MKKLFLLSSLIMSLLLLVTGCGKTSTSSSGANHELTYKGQTYTVPENPQKIVSLSNSILSMLYAVDGKAIARVESNDTLPQDQEALPTVGHTANPSIETIVGMQPDLILGLQSQHSKIQDQLNATHIPNVIINYDGINDNVPLINFLGELTNHQDKANQVINQYNQQIDKVKEAIKDQKPAKVAVLRATGKGVTAETDNAITASMVKELGMTNMVMNHFGDNKKDAKTIPYSLESLAADNPDIIFVVTMGKEADITAAMKKEMTDNPAWNDLQAVKNNKVIYLPSKLFLLNPGLDTPKAMARLVKEAYGITINF